MLSKSSARVFFIGGTTLFSLIFLGLTVDTVRQAPERTNAHKLTPEVARGKRLWDENNCMGCHTLMGEGGYYAPELTKVLERRGAVWIDLFLQDPQAMYPGRRKMIQYGFSKEERADLIAFLGWIGEMNLNGFPKRPRLAPATAAAATPASGTAGAATGVAADAAADPLAGAPKLYRDVCVACHALGGGGGSVGPALDGLAARMAPAAFATWMANPQAVKPGSAMPNFNLTAAQIDELSAFLLNR